MDASLKTWLKTVPVSKMVYPQAPADRLKYWLWRILRPMHPYVRNVLGFIGYMKKYDKYRPGGRQPYLVGTLAPGVTPLALGMYLVDRGYGNHFIALRDQDELYGLRYSPTFEHQYHIRVFKDGEVRAHFEYTTESHPLLHDKAIGTQERREEFLTLLDGYITPAAATA